MAGTNPLDFEKDTLLVVDDDPVNLGIVAGFLEAVGFDIHTVDNGISALNQVRELQPDLILLDVMMPGIDGFEVCQRLKADNQTKHIPVIFMTSLADVEDKIRGFEAGAVDYVTKPMRPQEMLARVNAQLEIRHLTKNLQEQAHELQITNDELLNVTEDLRDANLALSRRAIQLEACNQVAQQITSILSLDQLLPEVVQAIQHQFGYYFVGIWLLNEAQTQVLLQVGAGRTPEQTLTPGIAIDLEAGKSIIAWVCQHGEAYLSENVDHDSQYLPDEGLPGTQAELALPLKIGDTLIGVLGILSDQVGKFDDEDKRVLQTLANQISVAIHNAWKYEVEKQLHALQEERATALAKLNADKDKFFSIISHDLRNPFNNVLGNARLMAKHFEELSQQELHDMTQSIYRGARTAYSLLDNLLTWSRMQREGGMEVHPEELEVFTLAQETIELLKQTADKKDIELHSDIEKGLIAYADKNMLDTVLRNLANNALKFTPRGGAVNLTARVKTDQAAESDDLIEVTVADTGIGMSQENLEKIFRLDVSHSTPGTEKEEGTGLGLIICKEMIERNGGHIWVESESGKGTTVGFSIPHTPPKPLPASNTSA